MESSHEIEDCNEDDFDEDYGLLTPEQIVVVRVYGDDEDDQVLNELRPRYIIEYDPNQDFIRRIEVCLHLPCFDDELMAGTAGLSKLKSWISRTSVLHGISSHFRGTQVSGRTTERKRCF